MKINSLKNFFIKFIVIASVVGFPLVASFSSAFRLDSTPLSIFLRSITLILSCALIVQYFTQHENIKYGFGFSSLMIFWALYILRLCNLSLGDIESLSRPIWFYWVFGLGVCFIPMISIVFGCTESSYSNLYSPMLLLGLIALFVALFFGGTYVGVGQASYDSGRFRLESLNPISFGHLATTVALMSYWRLRRGIGRRNLLIYGSLFLIGAVGLFLSASRGPLMAFILCLLFFEYTRSIRKLFSFIYLGTFSVAVSLLCFDWLFENIIKNFMTLRIAEINDASAMERIIAYRGCLEQFWVSPLLGSSIEEKITGFYPHNLFLEGLISTGLIGLIFLILWSIFIIVAVVKIIRNNYEDGWIALIFLQYWLGSQVSGAVYTSGTMWVLSGLVVSLHSRMTNKPYGTHADFTTINSFVVRQ